MLLLLVWTTLWPPLLYTNSFSQNPAYLWDQHCYLATNSPLALDLGSLSFPPYPYDGWNREGPSPRCLCVFLPHLFPARSSWNSAFWQLLIHSLLLHNTCRYLTQYLFLFPLFFCFLLCHPCLNIVSMRQGFFPPWSLQADIFFRSAKISCFIW